MHWIAFLERKFGRWTLPHLLPLLLIGQVLVYVALQARAVYDVQLLLIGEKVFEGELWRAFTFMVVPMDRGALWFMLGVYVTWLIGSSLVAQWGEFRFNLYIGLGWFLTVVASLVFPFQIIANVYLMGMLTLAFARLYPDVEFLIFFLLPVKVKYLAWILWGFYLLQFIQGGDRPVILAAVSSYALFFGADHLREIGAVSRRKKFQKEAVVSKGIPFHTCAVCGKTNLSHPQTEFRYSNGQCTCAGYLREGKCDA